MVDRFGVLPNYGKRGIGKALRKCIVEAAVHSVLVEGLAARGLVVHVPEPLVGLIGPLLQCEGFTTPPAPVAPQQCHGGPHIMFGLALEPLVAAHAAHLRAGR